MKSTIVALCLLLFLVSCASGPVHVAKTEKEGIKSSYADRDLQKLYVVNEGFLRETYFRLTRSNVAVYEEGIGFTTLKDQKGRKHGYLMIYLRPAEIYFDVNKTKPEQRFSYVFHNSLEKYLRYVRSDDLQKDDVQGLAFGIYWPVRDFSQCDTYGGFIEYLHVYFKKEDIQDYLDRNITFVEAIKDAEVFMSLDSGTPVSVRPTFRTN
jgi:hypothetical protein